MTTAYDRVAYPSAVFLQTHPERLAVLLRLAGLEPAEPRSARILEIGGGDCLNVLSYAAMWPDCEVHGFDLSEVAIARGQAFAEAAGLTNATLVVDDIMEAHRRYPAGSFDYVSVHGVYAWVPGPVRAAILQLVAHVLSDRGVAMVSYNAMPGGHVRLIMREMLLNIVGDIKDFDSRMAATRAFLQEYGKPRDDDETLEKLLREHARSMLDRPESVLFHDELGDCYAPQALIDVVNDGAAVGLRHLTDAGRNRHLDGFLHDGAEVPADPDAEVLGAAVRDDYASLRYFRHTLFVKDSQVPDRTIDVSRMQGLWLSNNLILQDDGTFKCGNDTIEVKDPVLAEALTKAGRAYPQHVPIAEVASSEEHLKVVLQLFTQWYVQLFTNPSPFPAQVGERPRTSALVRAMLALGERAVCALDHQTLKIDQPELRALLLAADGSRSLEEIAAAGHGIPPEDTLAALNASAKRALIA